MNAPVHSLAVTLALVLVAAQALAFNPGTAGRAGDTAMQTSGQTICEGGPNDGLNCANGNDCLDPQGTCTGIAGAAIEARGTLTVIADTVLSAPGPGESNWDEDTPVPPCSDPAVGAPNDCEGISTSSLTLVLEFVRNGESYVIAETFTDLFDPTGTFPGFVVAPNGYAGWNQTVGESNIAESSADGSEDVLIRWGILPPSAEAAVLAILGGTPGQRVALSRVDDVPVCTDPAACNHSGGNTSYADHSGGTDVLATVRRWKVDLTVLGP